MDVSEPFQQQQQPSMKKSERSDNSGKSGNVHETVERRTQGVERNSNEEYLRGSIVPNNFFNQALEALEGNGHDLNQLKYEKDLTEAQQALQSVQAEKQLMETALLEQSTLMGQQIIEIQKKVSTLSAENEFLRRKKQKDVVTTPQPSQRIYKVDTKMMNDPDVALTLDQQHQAHFETVQAKLDNRHKKTLQLEAQIQAEQQDRQLRNEEISLLLERITQLDNECATRQEDIEANERLYNDVQGRDREIQSLRESIHNLEVTLAKRTAQITKQQKDYTLALHSFQEQHQGKHDNIQNELNTVTQDANTVRQKYADMKVQLQHVKADKEATIAAHEQALIRLKNENSAKLVSAVSSVQDSHNAAIKLVQNEADAERVALLACLRAEQAESIHRVEAAAEERLQETIVSKDRALSNAISTLQESLKFAQNQKSIAAIDEIKQRLEAESHARIKLLEQQAQADAQKEIQDVRVKEQQQHWEQRCQLLDEAATASRNYEANMQELRNQMKIAEAGVVTKITELEQRHANALKAEQGAHAKECQALSLRYSEALQEQNRLNANNLAGIAGRLLLTNSNNTRAEKSVSVPSKDDSSVLLSNALQLSVSTSSPTNIKTSSKLSSIQTEASTTTTSSSPSFNDAHQARFRQPPESEAIRRAQTRLEELSQKLHERERLLQTAKDHMEKAGKEEESHADVGELTIEVGLLQAQITRLQQLLRQHDSSATPAQMRQNAALISPRSHKMKDVYLPLTKEHRKRENDGLELSRPNEDLLSLSALADTDYNTAAVNTPEFTKSTIQKMKVSGFHNAKDGSNSKKSEGTRQTQEENVPTHTFVERHNYESPHVHISRSGSVHITKSKPGIQYQYVENEKNHIHKLPSSASTSRLAPLSNTKNSSDVSSPLLLNSTAPTPSHINDFGASSQQLLHDNNDAYQDLSLVTTQPQSLRMSSYYGQSTKSPPPQPQQQQSRSQHKNQHRYQHDQHQRRRKQEQQQQKPLGQQRPQRRHQSTIVSRRKLGMDSISALRRSKENEMSWQFKVQRLEAEAASKHEQCAQTASLMKDLQDKLDIVMEAPLVRRGAGPAKRVRDPRNTEEIVAIQNVIRELRAEYTQQLGEARRLTDKLKRVKGGTRRRSNKVRSSSHQI